MARKPIKAKAPGKSGGSDKGSLKLATKPKPALQPGMQRRDYTKDSLMPSDNDGDEQ